MRYRRSKKRSRRWDEGTHVTIATLVTVLIIAGVVVTFGYVFPAPIGSASAPQQAHSGGRP